MSAHLDLVETYIDVGLNLSRRAELQRKILALDWATGNFETCNEMGVPILALLAIDLGDSGILLSHLLGKLKALPSETSPAPQTLVLQQTFTQHDLTLRTVDALVMISCLSLGAARQLFDMPKRTVLTVFSENNGSAIQTFLQTQSYLCLYTLSNQPSFLECCAMLEQEAITRALSKNTELLEIQRAYLAKQLIPQFLPKRTVSPLDPSAMKQRQLLKTCNQLIQGKPDIPLLSQAFACIEEDDIAGALDKLRKLGSPPQSTGILGFIHRLAFSPPLAIQETVTSLIKELEAYRQTQQTLHTPSPRPSSSLVVAAILWPPLHPTLELPSLKKPLPFNNEESMGW